MLMSAILNIENLEFSYPKTDGNDGYTISLPKLDLNPSDVIAITGVSGCGKSTILECLALLRKATKVKHFSIQDYDVLALPYEKRELLRSGLLGFMPQTGGLIPYLTVFDNIKLQVQVALKQRATLQKELKGNSILTKDRVRDLLENSKTLAKDFGIDDLLKRFPHELSIGQRQRAVFLKSISHKPSVILIDEPTSSLDPEHGQSLFANIVELCQKTKVAALVVTHDLHLVLKNLNKALDYQRVSATSGQFVLKQVKRA